MRRVLFLLLLSVNLQMVITEGGISMRIMSISAQTMMYEMLDEVVVESSKVQCIYCSKYYDTGDMLNHEAVCPMKLNTCPTCGQAVYYSELQSGSHHCPGSEDTNDRVDDSQPNIGGGGGCGSFNNGTSHPSYGGGGISDEDGGEIGPLKLPNLPWNQVPTKSQLEIVFFEDYSQYSTKILNVLPQIHLVTSFLPENLPKQTLGYECVARAIALISNINLGASYQNAYQIITGAANENGVNFAKDGIPLDKINDVFKHYGTIVPSTYYAEDVEQSIDNHEAVMGMLKVTGGYHMVSIIGYDATNYYCAVGYENAVSLPKELFNERPIFNLLEKISIIKCKKSLQF